MKVISFLNPERLKNDVDYVFQNRVAGLAEVLPVEAKQVVEIHKKMFNELDEIYKANYNQTKQVTAQIVTLTNQMFSDLKTLKLTLEALTMVEAYFANSAKKVLEVLNSAGSFYHVGRVTMMARARKFLNGLKSLDPKTIQESCMASKIEEIEATLVSLQQLLNERVELKAAIVKGLVSQKRKQVDGAYISLATFVNAMAQYSGTSQYDEFVAQVDHFVLEAKQKYTALTDEKESIVEPLS